MRAHSGTGSVEMNRRAKDQSVVDSHREIAMHNKYLGIAVLTLLVTCGCAAGAPVDQASPPASSTAQQQPRTVSFKDTYKLGSTIDIKVADITFANLPDFPETSDDNAKKGDPYQIFTVTLRNASKQKLKVNALGTVTYGPKRESAPSVYIGVDQLDTIPAGQTASFDWAYIVPSEFLDDVVLEVAVDVDLEKAVFSGSIKRS